MRAAGVLVFVISAPGLVVAATVSVVTGADPVTRPDNQAETGINVSVVGGNRVETVTYNDETSESPSFVNYTPTTRTISSGYSLLGWSSRTRTAATPDPAWTHSKLHPPAGVAALYGDPSIASNPGLSSVVIISSLMVPATKFPAPSIVGTVAGRCSPLGGACVARSTDGGVNFSIVNCFGDTRDTGTTCPAPFEPTKGHFFDGGASAVTTAGGIFTGWAAFIDTDLSVESVWKMNDVTSGGAFGRDTGRTGTMGDTGDEGKEGELGPIGTHERLRADGADLWKMSRDGTDLKVNIHGHNAAFRVIADNHQTPFTVAFPPDTLMQPVGVRTGPQFAFDIGVNEAGQREMRFIYAARDTTTNKSFLQGGFCTIDLSDCERPAQWRMPAAGSPVEFHPNIKFGVTDPTTGKGTWRVTFLALPTGGGSAVFSADLVRPDLAPGSPTFNSGGLVFTELTTAQTPCPDLRLAGPTDSEGYWGDYDDMTYDPVTGSFVRSFTDSTLGCVSRFALTSTNVHVSTVETAPPDRKLNVVGTLVQLKDIDNCPPCDSTLDNVPIDIHDTLNAAHPVVKEFYEQCLDHDVKLRIIFDASLSTADFQTLHVCARQGLREESGFLAPSVCDEDVDTGASLCFDIPPGGNASFNDGGLEIPDFATARWNVVVTNTN